MRVDEEAAAAGEIWASAMDFLQRLRLHYPLYFVFLFLFFFLTLLMYLFVDPTYTAYATIGPPNQSPVDSLLSGAEAVPANQSSACWAAQPALRETIRFRNISKSCIPLGSRRSWPSRTICFRRCSATNGTRNTNAGARPAHRASLSV